jgi:hypothetical protein
MLAFLQPNAWLQCGSSSKAMHKKRNAENAMERDGTQWNAMEL